MVLPNWWQPPPGSWLRRHLDRIGRTGAGPDNLVIGIRMLAGTIAGERSRWSYRSSAVDPFPFDDATAVRHGTTALLLRFAGPDDEHRSRAGYDVWTATELRSGATVAISFPSRAVETLRLPPVA